MSSRSYIGHPENPTVLPEPTADTANVAETPPVFRHTHYE